LGKQAGGDRCDFSSGTWNFGEDGTLQGLLEMVGIPYVGCGVTASAVGMDKVIQKAVYEKEGLPVVKYEWFTREEWKTGRKQLLISWRRIWVSGVC